MSRAETLMLVALGFALGTLLALLFGRLVWHMAVRVGSRRMQRQMPSTLVEMQAERDRLRAECAMLTRKLEIRSDELKSQLVEQSAELTRERNRNDLTLEEVREREAALLQREQQMGSSHEQTSHLEAELAARTNALHDTQAQLQESHDAITRLRHDLSELTSVLAERDRRIAELQHHLTEQPLRIESAMRQEQVNTADRLERRIEELTALSREIAQQRYSFNRERHELAALAATVEVAPDSGDHVDSGYERSAANFAEVTNQERSIDRMLTAAERETLALAAEVEQLEPLRPEFPQLTVPDDMRPASGRLVEPREPELPAFGTLSRPAGEEKQQRGLANVVSLAARIRALQKNITG
jgi:chromosome segregation ATPase